MLDALRDFWHIIVTIGGGLVWLVRLEAGTRANATELTRQRDQRNEDLRDRAASRSEANALLAEIRADIKLLMQRGMRE